MTCEYCDEYDAVEEIHMEDPATGYRETLSVCTSCRDLLAGRVVDEDEDWRPDPSDVAFEDWIDGLGSEEYQAWRA